MSTPKVPQSEDKIVVQSQGRESTSIFEPLLSRLSRRQLLGGMGMIGLAHLLGGVQCGTSSAPLSAQDVPKTEEDFAKIMSMARPLGGQLSLPGDASVRSALKKLLSRLPLAQGWHSFDVKDNAMHQLKQTRLDTNVYRVWCDDVPAIRGLLAQAKGASPKVERFHKNGMENLRMENLKVVGASFVWCRQIRELRKTSMEKGLSATLAEIYWMDVYIELGNIVIPWFRFHWDSFGFVPFYSPYAENSFLLEASGQTPMFMDAMTTILDWEEVGAVFRAMGQTAHRPHQDFINLAKSQLDAEYLGDSLFLFRFSEPTSAPASSPGNRNSEAKVAISTTKIVEGAIKTGSGYFALGGGVGAGAAALGKYIKTKRQGESARQKRREAIKLNAQTCANAKEIVTEAQCIECSDKSGNLAAEITDIKLDHAIEVAISIGGAAATGCIAAVAISFVPFLAPVAIGVWAACALGAAGALVGGSVATSVLNDLTSMESQIAEQEMNAYGPCWRMPVTLDFVDDCQQDSDCINGKKCDTVAGKCKSG